MKRRQFGKGVAMLGAGISSAAGRVEAGAESDNYYHEPAGKLPVRKVDVVVAGGGTAGVVAALAAARNGAKTLLVENKGYTGGTIVEGGTALHSFFNTWKPFPGVGKRQLVRGIPSEIIDRLIAIGGCSGHAEMDKGYDYDSVCTAIDTELYKLVTMRMLQEAGVHLCLNTMLTGAIMDDIRVLGVVINSRSGREAVYADSFVDCTAYGDLAAYTGAKYTEPNDYACCNSVGIGNVDIDRYTDYVESCGEIDQIAYGIRSGRENGIVRVQGPLGAEFRKEAKLIGMSPVTTTVHDNYLMFIKCNYKVPGNVNNRDDMAKAEVEVRSRMFQAVELFRRYVPGCENAFMARTAPSLCIRRGRTIKCDYDLTNEEVVGAKHFDDDVLAYGFHDFRRVMIGKGESYGIPYRALRVADIDNLMCAGMMITSDHAAHMSTRNTVSCMAQGQAAGTAAALCSKRGGGTRGLPYSELRSALLKDGVYLES